MADRAVGTATSYPLDRTHLPPCDEIPCHSGDKASSPVYPSRIKYGDPTSPFGGAGILPPPPAPPETTVGTVIVTGDTDGIEVNGSGNYSAAASGDAIPFIYKWTAVGGTVRGSASARTCTVDWTIEGAGSVTCQVSSNDPGVTDSPQSDTLNITVNPEPPPPPPPTSIGALTITGDKAPTENDVTTYSVAAGGDASGLSYAWTIEGGTPTGATTGASCEVTWGAAGAGKVTCKVTSSDAGVTDSPKSKSEDIVIAVVFSLPSIGDVTFSGPQNPTEKTDASYEAMNSGDAEGLEYSWNISGGTINGSKSKKKVDVTCGNAGTMVLQCRVSSAQDGVTDSPQMKEASIPVAMEPAHIGKVIVEGMTPIFIGDEETYTCSFDGNIKSPIYRWKLAGVGGEIITFGGLNDDKVGIRANSPGSFDVICEVDADDWMVEERNVRGQLTVQVQS